MLAVKFSPGMHVPLQCAGGGPYSSESDSSPPLLLLLLLLWLAAESANEGASGKHPVSTTPMMMPSPTAVGNASKC